MKYEQKLKQALQELEALKEKITKMMAGPLEVGIWYKSTVCCQLLVFIESDRNRYGFTNGGLWFDSTECPENLDRDRYVEASDKEVEIALVNEAKRRGFSIGSKVYPAAELGNGTFSIRLTNGLDMCRYIPDKNSLRIQFGVDESIAAEIFRNGKWAEVVEVDKFAELKEAHKNGAVIQYKFGDLWYDCAYNRPSWVTNEEYRIKPEERLPEWINDGSGSEHEEQLRDKEYREAVDKISAYSRALSVRYPRFIFTTTVEDDR